MYRIRACRCACCELQMDIAVDVSPILEPPVCARCRSHRGDSGARHPDISDLRHRDHEVMYRNALAEAQDQTTLAQGERDFYRDRSVTVAKSGETLVRVLTKIDDLHHGAGRCSCGQSGCPVQSLLAEPAVARLIGTYDEEQLTLMELRRANPGACHEEWDYVDVTLVYPFRDERPAGRHRAAG